MTSIHKDASDDFIAKWSGVAASELSTAQSFAMDLCHLLGVELPHPDAEQQYMFERPVTFTHGDGSKSAGRIDLYKRGCFVLEAKKLKAPTHTKGFDDALLRARSQAEQYARALPASEGRPPFLIVLDVGNRIELYSEFSRSGATYTPFPDPRSHRIALTDLRHEAILNRLRKVWTAPLTLDPSRESARVTREIAGRLAALARSLEAAGHAPERVAQFLMRCLFTMFAEDVRLLPADSFRDLLLKYADQPDTAMRMLAQLWRDMDGGGFSAAIASDVLRFNGKLFKQPDTLPLTREQVALLIEAAKAKWEHVEPAIFGTLLERALDPGERHKLGAHYTPRAYVERLVLPTVIEPLREEWNDAHAAALIKAAETSELEQSIAELPPRAKEEKNLSQRMRETRAEAIKIIQDFHHRLCTVRVLDPACGSGNFLYVTLEHLKRLEGEVLNALDELGFRQAGLALGGERADTMGGETVDPHQLLGIELNPRAAAIAEVVLWIGYLQWHYRTHGDVNPPQPVIRDFRNIENRDAVLAYDRVDYVLDERGMPMSRWDGVSMKPSPVTGEAVPDDSRRVPLELYVNPRKAAWPQADFVVGNPPFIGSKRMRDALGDGYVDAIQAAWPEIPQATDFVMRWWHHAALLTAHGGLQRFGLITTNSLRQAYVRRAVEPHLDGEPPMSLAFAVPDHPWVDSEDGAAVRIAITVGARGRRIGQLLIVTEERTEAEDGNDDLVVTMESRFGRINADLSVGVDVTRAASLHANQAICSVGMKTIGTSFQIEGARAVELGLGTSTGLEKHIRPYINGRDVSQTPRGLYVIDFYGMEEDQVRAHFPAPYQHLLERAKPERDLNRNAVFRERWWIIGHPRQQFRVAVAGLDRYIVTLETSKHRFFCFLSTATTPDSSLVTIADERASTLGVLSSEVHTVWALTTGGRLGVGNDPRYNKTRCFETFPFPSFESAHTHLDGLAEQLDAHRKRQQAAYPDLTLTGMYNVLEKLRRGQALTAKERVIHEHGLVSVLRQLHDEIDAAVLSAYGWSDLLALLRVAHGNDVPAEGSSCDEAKRAFDEAILERLIALNAERAAEEASSKVRWLRPAFQNPSAQVASGQRDLDTALDDDSAPITAITGSKPLQWPKDTVAQVRAVADTLAASSVPLSVDDIATRFTARGPWKKRLPQLLDMLVALGRARASDDRYSGT
ncbi:DNA methyltransferase [Dyella sp. EPa41]|uniref:class I SAM-dependent DNA methyltransferase n=1 Tax=Dyella sp. EPa41 TaxID=1561194 RepID=UPI001916633A|nr:DNA methyltransferase [Dyella sp. EPa41]